MNFGVIGLGSMGKRRIRLIKDNFPEINVVDLGYGLLKVITVIRHQVKRSPSPSLCKSEAYANAYKAKNE